MSRVFEGPVGEAVRELHTEAMEAKSSERDFLDRTWRNLREVGATAAHSARLLGTPEGTSSAALVEHTIQSGPSSYYAGSLSLDINNLDGDRATNGSSLDVGHVDQRGRIAVSDNFIADVRRHGEGISSDDVRGYLDGLIVEAAEVVMVGQVQAQ